THPYEADMPWAIAKSKPFFVGQRSIEIQNAKGLTRKLVGFTLADASAAPPEECHLVVRGPEIVGRVTSAVRSPSLDRVVGLAYVAPDQAEPGKTFDIKVAGDRLMQATVIPIPFYDPENKRQELGSIVPGFTARRPSAPQFHLPRAAAGGRALCADQRRGYRRRLRQADRSRGRAGTPPGHRRPVGAAAHRFQGHRHGR